MKYRSICIIFVALLAIFFADSVSAQIRRSVRQANQQKEQKQPTAQEASVSDASSESSSVSKPSEKTAVPVSVGSAVDAVVLKLTPQQQADIEVTKQKAFELFHQGDLSRAARLIELASNLDPGISPPAVLMAKWAAAAGRKDLTHLLLDSAVETHPDDPEAYFLLADIARIEQRRTDATLLLARGQEILESYRRSPVRKLVIEKSMWSNLANLAEMKQDYEGTIACLEKLALLEENANANTQIRFGLTYLKRAKAGDEDLAIKAFEKAFQLDPAQLPPQAMHAQILLQKGEQEKAETLLKEVLAQYENHPGLLSFTASHHISQGRLEDAKKTADRLQAVSPDSLEAEKLQGQLAFAMNKREEAEASFRKVLSKHPEDADSATALIMILLDKKDEQSVHEAVSLAESNARRSPSQEGLALLAWGFFLEGKKDLANHLVDQILSGGSLSPNGAYYTAAILTDQGKKEAAVGFLKAALQSKVPFFKQAETETLVKTLTETSQQN